MNATKLDSLSRTFIDTTMVTRAYISNTCGLILYVLSRTTHMTFNEKLRVLGKTCKNAICNISAGAVATDVNIGMFAFGDTNPIQSCRPYWRWDAGMLRLWRLAGTPNQNCHGPCYNIERAFVSDKPLKASISRRVWLYKNDCCLDGQFILVLSNSFGDAIQAFHTSRFLEDFPVFLSMRGSFKKVFSTKAWRERLRKYLLPIVEEYHCHLQRMRDDQRNR
jgi:hypothetical protein